MKNQYIIAIDGGTQSTKVGIFDTVGTEVCSHTIKLREIELGENGRAEHPEDDLWDSLKLACHEMFKKFHGDKKDIIGVGLGSIRCCRALIKENGDLMSPVQSWMDLRLSRPYEHDDDNVKYVTTTTGYLTYRLTGETKDTRSNYVGPWPIDPMTLDWFEDKEKFDKDLKLSGVALTKAGKELLDIIPITNSENYKNELIKFLETKHLDLAEIK